MESKIFDEAIRSVRDPILQFIETGIFGNPWGGDTVPEEVLASKGFISATQTQRVCRMVAQELKRPFIIMTPYIERRVWTQTPKPDGTTRWECKPVPRRFRSTHIKMPKRQYLMPLVSPLLLAAGPAGSPVTDRSEVGNWVFIINDEGLWNDYRASLDRPEMRAARKLPPLPE
jgi:hypothetical protein